MTNQLLHITAAVMMSLHTMRAEPKFVAAADYQPSSEEVRLESEQKINALLDRLIKGVEQHPQKSYVLSEFAVTLKQFDHADSEEQDRVGEYLEQIMDIFQIESSDGLINIWRYGFDPTTVPK
jgi:hypothetical protein